MVDVRECSTLRTIPFLIAVCLVGLPRQALYAGQAVSPETGTYVFLPDQSTVLQTGGFAGVHWTYAVEGQFQLTVVRDTRTASFTHVDANATDDSPSQRTLDPNEVFNLTGLAGTVVDDATLSFAGQAPDGSDVRVTVTLQDGLAYLVGRTTPPPNSADFFIFSLDAVAQRKYSGGTGEPNDPYQIATAADLIALGGTPEDYDKHFILTADIDLDPNLPGNLVFDRAVIAPDVNNTAVEFQGPAFTGVLDGKGHAMVGLVIDSDVPYVGLFGVIGGGGCVCNLRLVGGSVRGQARISEGTAADGAAGTLAAISQGLVTGCCSTGSVSGTIQAAGGLVGCNDYGTISACYSTGSVRGSENVGGLAGYSYGGTISACYSTGSVSGNCSVGGLVGSNDGTISACYSTGLVSGGDDVGGLVGSNGGTISACFWDTQTSGRTWSYGGTGLTTSLMVAMQTFVDAGWDFLGERANGLCEYWQMPAGSGYPVLSIFNGYVPHNLQGTGTLDDPYLLETAEDFGAVWCSPMACYRLAADTDLSGIRWRMAVIPAFLGSLDGQGHRITGMTITGGGHLGLIGFLYQGAAVKDLGLEDVNNVSSGDYVGALVGYNFGREISTCYSTGSVSTDSVTVNGGGFVGGLVGYNYHGVISACHSTASVSGTNKYSGGLVGYNSHGTISACHTKGSVSGNYVVGGLVGENCYGAISACYSTGKVGGTRSRVAGGLVGGNDCGTISACYSTGSVSGGWDVGGLAGATACGTISGCHSTGSVSGEYAVGGLVGTHHSGTILVCYSTGSVNGTGEYSGGLVGRNREGGTISACYATGPVSGSGHVGGLVGYNYYGEISACYATGSVSGSEHEVGGLLGRNACGTISACYSAGLVRGSKGVGGLVGYNHAPRDNRGEISACFWDIHASGQTASAGGTGLATTEMQTAKTYLDAGWDFVGETANGTEDIWWILEGKDYPRLWWEAPAIDDR